MRSRSRTRTPNNGRSHQHSPFSHPRPSAPRDEQPAMEPHPPPSSDTSATTSRHASNTSIFSMPFASPHSRHSTPPTPLSSPSLYRPPSQLLVPNPDYGSDVLQHHLHPSQYRQVRETHSLDVDYDPVSGRKTINHYSIIDEIGRGTHGKVKLGFDMVTYEMVAIKVVERSQGRPRLGRRGDGENPETKIRREIAILKKIRHENVVRLLEVIDDARFKKVYLVLEYVVRGEVVWRRQGDTDLIMRDRKRVRKEAAAQRAKLTDGNPEKPKEEKNSLKRRKPKRKDSAGFWSLEFASDSESAAEDDADQATTHDDASDVESVKSIPEEDLYVPAMEIDEARRCFRDTVVGLDYLHWNGIIHRDIKPANLLWTDNKVTKISDFGVSFLGRPIRDADDEGTGDDEPTGFEQNELELAKTAGTPAFFAPELCCVDPLQAKTPITGAIDVWALGVTLFCFVYGRLPFMADSEYKLFKSISEDELIVPLRRIRANKPEIRPDHCLTPEELEEHETEPVHEDLRDLIKRLLHKNPSNRIVLKEVKRHPWVLEGLPNPIEWVDQTDLERTSHGNKIEVTTEDVETAVSTPGLITRAKSAIRKATNFARGLRKRGSSTAGARDGEAAGSDAGGEYTSKQGQKSFIHNDPEEKELQWMGRIEESRCGRREMLNDIVPSTTNPNVTPNETAHLRFSNTAPNPRIVDSNGLSKIDRSGDRHLRRKKSMNLLGSHVLRRHSSHSNDIARTIRAIHRSPIDPPPTPYNPPPQMFKSESTAALTAPTIIRRIVRSTKSDDLGRGGGRISTHYAEPLPVGGAKEFLTEALHSAPGNAVPILPTQYPEPRSLYTVVDDTEHGVALNVSSPTRTPRWKEKIDRQRREEQEQARRRLGKPNLDDDSEESPTSPDHDVSHPQIPGPEYTFAERQKALPTDSNTIGSYNASPMAMTLTERNVGFFDLHNQQSPKSPRASNLVSSSSDERFNTTANSSLSNSTGFPSQLTNPSSVSSDYFGHFSRRGSLLPIEQVQESNIEDDQRIRDMQRQRQRRGSEYIFTPDQDENDSGSDSEGGFEMGPSSKRAPTRAKTISIAELERTNNESKNGILATRTLHHGSKNPEGSAIVDKNDLPRQI